MIFNYRKSNRLKVLGQAKFLQSLYFTSSEDLLTLFETLYLRSQIWRFYCWKFHCKMG